jgi:hypothetical protein
MRQFPAVGRVRELTNDFSLQSDSNAPARSEFFSLSAISNFSISEFSPGELSRSLPSLQQDDCASLEIKQSDGTISKHKIDNLNSDSSIGFYLTSDEYQIWKIVNSKQLEIITRAEIIDPCPPFRRFQSEKKMLLEWGTPNEINASSVRMTSRLLALSVRALDKPPALLLKLIPEKYLRKEDISNVINDDTEQIELPYKGLSQLRQYPLKTEVYRCPTVIQPPSSEELPPN